MLLCLFFLFLFRRPHVLDSSLVMKLIDYFLEPPEGSSEEKTEVLLSSEGGKSLYFKGIFYLYMVMLWFYLLLLFLSSIFWELDTNCLNSSEEKFWDRENLGRKSNKRNPKDFKKIIISFLLFLWGDIIF